MHVGVVMYTNRVFQFGTAKCVLFTEVSSFQGVEIQLYTTCIKNNSLLKLGNLRIEVVVGNKAL